RERDQDARGHRANAKRGREQLSRRRSAQSSARCIGPVEGARVVTFIKICGITNRRDAEAAVRLGADAIGFVFVRSSPRYVEPAAARSIAADLDVMTVGVFQDHDEDSVRRIADESTVSTIQLHGNESPELSARFDRLVIKAFRGPPADGYDVFATLVDG